MTGDGTIGVGSILSDNYRIERVLGRGGMATVFEASHLRLPRRVALKVITAQPDDAPEFLIRFRREAETLARLDHPHVVSVYDWNVTEGGQPYLVMELLCGEDLAHRLRRVKMLPKPMALHYFSQIAQALQAAHRHGIVHRDVKPSNVFLCKKGPLPDFVKVLDFGIAKQIIDPATVMTNEHSILGTPAYMSPEQARGENQKVDERTDQFALGLVLYEMLAGLPAFHRKGELAMTTLFRVLFEQPPPLADGVMYEVILRALAKEPRERYPTLTDFVDAVLRGQRLSREVPICSPSPARSVLRRSRSGVWSGALLLSGGIFLQGEQPALVDAASIKESATALPHSAAQKMDLVPHEPPSVHALGMQAGRVMTTSTERTFDPRVPSANATSRPPAASPKHIDMVDRKAPARRNPPARGHSMNRHSLGVQLQMEVGFPPGSSGESHVLGCVRNTRGLNLEHYRNQSVRIEGEPELHVTSPMAPSPKESLEACLSDFPADTVMMPSLIEVKVK